MQRQLGQSQRNIRSLQSQLESIPQERDQDASEAPPRLTARSSSSSSGMTGRDLRRSSSFASSSSNSGEPSFSSLPKLSAHSRPETPSSSHTIPSEVEVEVDEFSEDAPDGIGLTRQISHLTIASFSTFYSDPSEMPSVRDRRSVRSFDDSVGSSQPTPPSNQARPKTGRRSVARNESGPGYSSSRSSSLRNLPEGIEVEDEHISAQRSDEQESRKRVEIIVEQLTAVTKDMVGCDFDLFIEIIVGAMDEHDGFDGVQEFCLNAIIKVCKNDKVKKRSVALSGALNSVMRAMNSCSESSTVQTSGCELVRSLAVVNENRMALVRSGACPTVTMALAKFAENDKLAEDAIAALRSLSFESEARDLLRSMGASAFTVKAMVANRSCPEIQRDGCALLSNCAVDIKKQTVAVVTYEELDGIVQAMKNHGDNASVVASACFTLKNLTHESENCRTLRRCEGIMDHLTEVLTVANLPEESITDVSEVLERVQISLAADMSISEQACLQDFDHTSSIPHHI